MKSIIAEFRNKGLSVRVSGNQVDGMDKNGVVVQSVIMDGQGVFKDNKENVTTATSWERYTPKYEEGEWINDNGTVRQIKKEEAPALKAAAKSRTGQ